MASASELRPAAGEGRHDGGGVKPFAHSQPKAGVAAASAGSIVGPRAPSDLPSDLLGVLRRRTTGVWTGSLAVLGMASVVLLWTFRAEIAAAIYVWSNSATFGHAFFIVPISLFLFYRLRRRLAALRPAPALWGMVPVAALSLVWLVGELANLMVVKQLALVGLWQALFLLVLGWQVTRASLFPLMYLYLAVPFGSSIIPVLQDVTAQMVVHLLRLTDMPVFLDGYLIQIPSGSFLVAEACSGVRYLVVSVALGVLAAYLLLRSWPRRLFFVALSVVVPILANGVRAYGIIMLAHLSDYQFAVDVDHVLYGFIFLAMVTMALLGLAALLRDRHQPALAASPDPPASDSGLPRRPARHLLAVQAVGAGAAIAVTLLAQGWAAAARQVPTDLPAPHLPPAVAPWVPAGNGAPDWSPQFHGSDVTLRGGYRRGEERVDLHVAYYAYQREEAEAISDLNALLGTGRDWRAHDVAQARVEVAGRTHPYVRMRLAGRNDSYIVWYWYRIGGQKTNSRILGKLLEVKAAMTGGRPTAAVIAIAARVSEDAQRTESLLADFLNRTLDSDGSLVRFGGPPARANSAAGEPAGR